jgi:multicomponent Na+:H+ antiporter subunit G
VSAALDVVSWICLVAGVAFAMIGAIGLLRFPDLFTRMHAAGVVDTIAVGLVLLGLALQAPSWLVAAKLVLIFVFILFTSPTATHALARAALNGGVTPLLPGADASREGEPPSNR